MYGWVVVSKGMDMKIKLSHSGFLITLIFYLLFLMKIHLCEQKKNDIRVKGSSKIYILITLTEDAFI